MKINVDDLTVKQIKQITGLLKSGSNDSGQPFKIGQAYFFRLVTHYLTGKVIRVTAKEIILTEAAWIADTGRYMDFLKNGTPKEVEPYDQSDEIVIGRGALIDAAPWKHVMPSVQK